MKKIIRQIICEYISDIILIRRDIHKHPELGMEVNRTSEIVADELKKIGLEVQSGVGKMGVVGILRGKKPGKTLLIRADMDALAMTEQTNLDFKSINEGIMHACGHDIHTSVLIGAAKVLNEINNLYGISGNIKYVFQPAEESNPTGGAECMIKDRILQNPKIDAAIALHVWDMPVGKIGIKTGPIMAQSDRFYVVIKGESAHVSQPQNGIDPILASAHVIDAVQSIISRNIDPMQNVVISFSKINGGNTYNIIAEEVKLEGSVRFASQELKEYIPKRLEEVCLKSAEVFGCKCDFTYECGFPMTVNDENLTNFLINKFDEYFGKDNIIKVAHAALTGEDFSRIAKLVPSTYFWIGAASEKNNNSIALHKPTTVFDEDSIRHGIEALVVAAISYCNTN